MTTSKQTQAQQIQSQSSPWAPTQPILNGILSGVQGQLPNYATTPAEGQALNQLQTNAAGVPNFAPQASDITGQFLGGDPTGLIKSGLTNYTNELSPIATGNLDPTKTPGIQNLLATIRNDVSNSVNSQFAGAGRDLSGDNTQALARGISQGEAAPLLGQYNQNVQDVIQAGQGILNANNNASSAITGNQTQGFNLASNLPALAMQGPAGLLSALQQSKMLPLQNLGMFENLTVPIAGLGGQVSGTSNSQGTSTPSPLSSALGVFHTLFPFGFQAGGGK